jgi:cell division septation protein DedD
VPRNEDGEFELLLGNRQLMSVFFIVVILLGVFFAMGYIVGRNSSPVTAPETASRRPEPAKPAPVDASPARETLREAPASTEAPKETAPQQAPTAAPPAKPEPPAPAPARVSAAAQPESGKTYLQLSAIDHDKAEIMVEMLHKKSFPAIAAEIPEKPGVFRVLVGPISDADINKLRSDLQNASFPGKEAVKRTF